eukprot:PhF_6_TR9237/c0_g1_i1/m.14593
MSSRLWSLFMQENKPWKWPNGFVKPCCTEATQDSSQTLTFLLKFRKSSNAFSLVNFMNWHHTESESIMQEWCVLTEQLLRTFTVPNVCQCWCVPRRWRGVSICLPTLSSFVEL